VAHVILFPLLLYNQFDLGESFFYDIWLLHKCIMMWPEVLEEPGPSAVFRGFGDSSLDFELRCFLKDVERTVGVTSDLPGSSIIRCREYPSVLTLAILLLATFIAL